MTKPISQPGTKDISQVVFQIIGQGSSRRRTVDVDATLANLNRTLDEVMSNSWAVDSAEFKVKITVNTRGRRRKAA